MNKNYLLVLLLSLFIFQGCSSKQYFEPENTIDMGVGPYPDQTQINNHASESYLDEYFKPKRKTIDTGSIIIDYNSDGATLKDNRYISYEGISTKKLDDGYKFINNNNGIILSADNNGSLSILSNDKIEKLQFDKTIVSATIKDNLVAFITIDNTISIYDIKSNKIVFKEYLKQSIINDIKISNPIFLETVILYPSLDGKIVIVNKNTNTVIKTLNLDPKSDINNIIFIKTIGDSLVAATSNKLFSFVDGKAKKIDLDIKSITINEKNIYVATLDGNLIKFDEKLNKLKSKKFKFAKFYTIFHSQGLYALESQGYLIKLDDNFDEINIFDFYFHEYAKVISIDNKLYFEDEYITIK